MSQINEKAPLFELYNTNKEKVSLSSYAGETVILAFYPGAFTGVCDTEMCALQENMESFNASGAKVIGISVDSPWSNAEFAKKYNLDFELLSDLHREVVKMYDVTFEGLGGLDCYVSANRAVVIIDSEGLIKYRWVAENPGVEPNYDEVEETVKNLN